MGLLATDPADLASRIAFAFHSVPFSLGVLLFRGRIVRHKIWQAVLILPGILGGC